MSKTTVQLSGDLDKILSDLSKEQGVPKTQVIRRSLALLKYLEDERRSGGKVAITDQDGKVVKEIVTT